MEVVGKGVLRKEVLRKEARSKYFKGLILRILRRMRVLMGI